MFRTGTLGVQYFFNPHARVTLNYAINSLDVQNPGAIPAGAKRDNALAVANSFDNRLDLQVTLIF
ncbi:hypothetical protein BMS3Abin12_00631 [bacterium BMS3Abin12]|nr:hypothetical protein BMS3Abin12_00631 [bacterium BMS3Abin12]